MKIYSEINLENFEAWSGGENTLKRIIENGQVDSFESILEELYPEGMSDTQLNDLLRFDSDWLYEILGIRSESQIESEIEEKKSEVSDKEDEMQGLKYDFEDEVNEINSNREMAGMNEMDEEERKKLWESNYESDWNDYEEDLNYLKEELEELKEELENL